MLFLKIDIYVDSTHASILSNHRKQMGKKEASNTTSSNASTPLDKRYTSEAVGVDRNTGSKWEKKEGSNVKNHNASTPPDKRVTIHKKERSEIYERAKGGETHKQIAADYRVTRRRISQIVQQEESKENKPEEVETLDVPEGKYRCIVLDPPWPSEKIEREESEGLVREEVKIRFFPGL